MTASVLQPTNIVMEISRDFKRIFVENRVSSKKMYRPYKEEEVAYLKALDYIQTPVWIYDPFRYLKK
jgi:hypothetical protein